MTIAQSAATLTRNKMNGVELEKEAPRKDVQNPDLSVSSKSKGSSHNRGLAEAVDILQALASSSLYSSRPTKPVTKATLAKAVSILDKLEKSRDANIVENKDNTGLVKAITILKNLQGPKLSQHTKIGKENTATTDKPFINPNLGKQNRKTREFGSRIAKAIELLKEFQAPKLSDPKGTNNDDQTKTYPNYDVTPREESFSKSSTIPQESEETSDVADTPKLESEKPRTEKIPDLKTSLYSVDSNDVIKTQEKATNPPILSKSRESSDDQELQHIIDTVADKAAKEVEKSLEKEKLTTNRGVPMTVMPDLEHTKNSDNSYLMKALDDVQGKKSNNLDNMRDKDSSGSDQRSYFESRLDKVSPTRPRFKVPPFPTKDTALDNTELGPEIPSAQELRTLMKFRKNLNLKVGVERKKVDIPHNSFGNEVYMVVHFSFESIKNGFVMDDSGLHNDGKVSVKPAITTSDTKCGSAMTMHGGQILFNSKAFHNIPHEAITVVLWVKFETINNLYNLFTTEGTGAKYTFQVTDGKVHWSHLNDNGHVIFALETEPVVNLGDWTHVGATYDSRTNLSKVIVNGQVVGEKQGHGLLSQNWDGKAGIGLSGGIQGIVDEFYMFNRALAASDVADLSEECDLGVGEAIPVREGYYNGLIPEKLIEEAMARLSAAKSTTTTTGSTIPATTTLRPTTPTTVITTTKTTTTSTTKASTTKASTTKASTTTTTTKPQTTTPINYVKKSTPKTILRPTNTAINMTHPRPTIPPLMVAVDEPQCQESLFYYNSKLKGGMGAGLFIDLGHVHLTTECLKRCCQMESCDLIYLANDHCYAVDCFNADLCEPVQLFNVNLDGPSVYYIMRNGKSIIDKGTNKTSTAKNNALVPQQVPTKPSQSPYSGFEEIDDWDSVDEPRPTHSQIHDRGYCTQSMFFYNVKLTGGLKAGTILINTNANNMHECVRLCCEDRSCDIALMRKDECFTMHCPTSRCTVDDGGEFQISFVSRQQQQQGSSLDDSSLFPTTYVPSPTLGTDEEVDEHDNHSQFLSLYLGFEHVVGSVAVDGSGLNNDAKLMPGTSVQTGRVGLGASMNGGDILLHAKHFLGKPRRAITLAVWLKLSVTSGSHSVFSTTQSNKFHQKALYNFEIHNGHVRWYHRMGTSRIVFKIQTPRVIYSDLWYHVACTYDSSEGLAKVFVDGKVKGSAHGQGYLSQNWGNRAAFGSQDGRKILFGKLDEIYMFTRALSGKEIRKYVRNIQGSSRANYFTQPSTPTPTMPPFEVIEEPLLAFTKSPHSFGKPSQNSGSLTQALNERGPQKPTSKTTTHSATATKKETTTIPITKPTTKSTTTKPPSTTQPTTKPSTTTAKPATKPPTTTAHPTIQPSYTPTSKATTRAKPKSICKLGNVYRNRDLVGGLGAGNFTDKGKVSSIEECMKMCCNMENCTVAYQVGENCFAVECLNSRLCGTFTRTPISVSPVIGYVERYNVNGSLLSFFTSTAVPSNKPTASSSHKPPTQPLKEAGLLKYTSTTKIPTTPTCSHSDVYHHVTLKGGLKAGSFTKLAELSNMPECAKKCCARQKCDVAIMMGDTCFGLQCNSSELCETKPAHLKHFKLVMVYIQRNEPKGDQHISPTSEPHLRTNEPSLEELLGKVKPTNSPTTRSFLLDALGKIQSATLPVPKENHPLCSQGLRINNVILNGGMGSGEVTQYKNVSDVSDCAAKCCKSRGCHVAFVIQDVCYTIKCYSRDLCKTRPLEGEEFTSKVIYISRNGIAMFSSANEAKVGASTSDVISTARPLSIFASKTNTIPESEDKKNTTKASDLRCEAGNYFVNVRLRGDLSAGVFTKRGNVTSMAECSRFCCDDESCDLAYLLENTCYSVLCHSDELCQVVTSSSLVVNPTIAYVIRYNNDGTIQKKIKDSKAYVVTTPTRAGPKSTTHTITKAPTQRPKVTENEKEENQHPYRHHKHHHYHHHHHEDEDEIESDGDATDHYHLYHHKQHSPHLSNKKHKTAGKHKEKNRNHLHKNIYHNKHHLTNHHGNGHEDNHRKHPKPHKSHKDAHKTMESSGKKGSTHQDNELESFISHLSSEDLDTIASLHVAESGPELEQIIRCSGSRYGCQHYCINLNDGGHRCMCHRGYQLAVNGRDCEVRDECVDGNHGCEHRCIKSHGNHTCECNSGYILNADGKHCDDLDECKLEIHSCTQECQNTPGSYKCSCRRGYYLGSDRFTCESIDETEQRKDELQHRDRGLEIPTMIVESPKDLNLQQGQTAIFPCKARGHPAPHIAWAVGPNGDQSLPSDDRFGLLPSGALVVRDLNVTDKGIYRCVASNPAGSASRGAYLQVDDVNECSLGSQRCDQVCINTIGSYYCDCNHGYLLNSDKMCDDIDECENGSHSCNQTCHNTLGSYICSCLPGYELQHDRKTCADIDECSISGHGCTQLCNNTIGSYDCLCLSGYTLSSDNMTCIDQHTMLDSQKSNTLSAGMAAFIGLLVVSLILIIGSIIFGVHFMKRRSRGLVEDEEKAYRRSIFSWLE